MPQTRSARHDDLDDVVALLARLQADPAHHIGYFGLTPAELTHELGELAPDWPSVTVLCLDDSGRLRGVLAAGIDHELGRCWLHGPFVDVPVNHPAGTRIWDQTADRLLAAIRELPVMRGIRQLDLFGHVQHRRLELFAERHGFAAGKPTRVFQLDGDKLRSVLVRAAVQQAVPVAGQVEVVALPEDPVLRAEFVALHDMSFPRAGSSGVQLAENRHGHTVLVALRDGRFLGYATGKAQQELYHVDFVAVAERYRGQRVAPRLITGLVRELALRHGPRTKVCATINLGNRPSERMFGGMGFEVLLDLVGYAVQ